MAVKFHWRLLQGGETDGFTRTTGSTHPAVALPDIVRQAEFCRRAEESGIQGVLTDFGSGKPDSIVLATALGMVTQSIEFIIAHRSGLLCPTIFVQQLNSLSALTGGRLSLNIVAGHSPEEQRSYGDFLPHDERYARTGEFLEVARRFWTGPDRVNFRGRYYQVENGWLNTPYLSRTGRQFPELFIAGGSNQARDLAISQGTCWMRMAEKPEKICSDAGPVLAAGKEVGLRMGIICRHTRAEALGAARELIDGLSPELRERSKESAFIQRSDSVSMRAMHELAETEWLTPCLWTGAIRTHGAAAAALVGSPEEVAGALIEYVQAGVTQFILSGWPKLEEMVFFGREVIPLVRKYESAPASAAAVSR